MFNTGPVCSPSCPMILGERRAVEVALRLWRFGRWGGRTRLCCTGGRAAPNRVERWFQATREIGRGARSMDVHVEDARLLPEEVVVERGDVEAVCRAGQTSPG